MCFWHSPYRNIALFLQKDVFSVHGNKAAPNPERDMALQW